MSERGYAEADDVSERAVEVSGWGTGGIVSKGECHAYTRVISRAIKKNESKLIFLC